MYKINAKKVELSSWTIEDAIAHIDNYAYSQELVYA
jgi:hypothetical protein